MTMRPFTDNRGGLNHLVDAQIGRAFPVVHKVYEHLDAIEYIAQVYEAGRSRDIVIRTNHTKEWIEWQYKGENTWTILFKFSDLLGADIADVVAAERALAAELEQLRLQLGNDIKITLAARDVAIVARTGAEEALASTEEARDAAQVSQEAAAQSALTADQYAQDSEAAKTAAQQSADQAAADRTLANQAAQTAQSQATAAGASATSAAEAYQAAAGSAAEANAAKSATALLQSAADQSAQAAGQSQAAALGSANAAAVSAAAAGVSAESAAAYQVAAEAAAASGAQHLADIEAQVVSVETLKQETVDAQQASLAAKAGAEKAAVSAATFAENAGVSAAESATSANEAEASANSAELSAQGAAAHKAEAENQAVAAATLAQEATDKATAAEASALAAAASATTATEKLGEVSTLHDAAVTASTTATGAAETTTTHLAQVTALHSATESFAQAAQASAEQADIAATAADASASDALQLRNETQGFRDAASTMVVDAAQVSADRATVQTLAQEVQLSAGQAQSNALAAANSADTAVASASAAANSATNAQTNADVVQGQVTAITGRLDEAGSIVATVTTLRDETLSYKLAAQDSTTNAQVVAADRAAVADMMGTIAADAASATDSKDQALAAAATAVQAEVAANTVLSEAQSAAQEIAGNISVAQDAAAAALDSQTSASESATQAAASLTAVVPLHTEVVTKHAEVLVGATQVAEDLLATVAAKGAAETAQADAETAEALARAWATKIGGPVLNDGVDKFSAQYWATQSEQSALDAADANAGALAKLANHTAAADPHTQYLTKAESTDVLATKVDAVDGKGLSTEDFTSTEKTKLAGIAAGAQVNTVTAVAGKTGNVALTKADVGLGNIDNTSDTNKPVSTATQNALNNKVDKEAGKQLSTKDYTAAEKTKLAGIDAGANAYTHPAKHPASIITQDENNRFVTDAEKVAWNAKQTTLVSGTNIKTINGESLLGEGDLVVAGGGPTLQGDTAPYATQTKTYQITNYNSFSSYAVSASAGTASISGDTITYTAPATAGSVGLTLTVDGQPTVFAVAVQAAPSYIPTPTPTPTNFGDPLEGGFYAGMVWGQIAQSSTSMAIATGSKTFRVADMSSAPIVYVGQMVEVRSRANPIINFVGTVTSAAGTSLTINVTSIGGSGTFSDWSVMARHRVIVAPKASGEHAGIALKNTSTAMPTACQTLTEGFAATQAMRDADSSTVYPAAHWARNLNIGGRTDWYIPARDELELCWRNLKPTTDNNYTAPYRPTGASFNYANNGSYGDTDTLFGTNKNSSPTGADYANQWPAQTTATAFRTGGAEAFEYGSSYYWSSSDYSDKSAWFQCWNSSFTGTQNHSSKVSSSPRVRAVRRSII